MSSATVKPATVNPMKPALNPAMSRVMTRIFSARSASLFLIAVAVAGVGAGCSKTVAINLELIEPCDQTNQALNGASSFSIASQGSNVDGTSTDDVITFNSDQGPQPLNVTLGDVTVTVKAFADDITAGGGASAVPQAVGRSMPIKIEPVSGDQTAIITVGKLDTFGKTTNADGECTSLTAGADIPGRHGHTATFVPQLNRVLIYGGAIMGPDGPDDERLLSTAELWDPATGEYEPLDGTAGARAYHAATALPDGRVFISGGFGVVSGSLVTLTTAEIFDPTTQEFSTIALKQPRAHHTSTLMAGPGLVVLVGGCVGTGAADLCTPTQAGNGNRGISTDLIAKVETFDISQNITTVALADTVSLQRGRAFHQATSLENGQQTLLVVSGGVDPDGPVCDVELFRATGADLAVVDPGLINTTFPANQCPARHAAVSVLDAASNQPKALFIGGQTVATGGEPQGPGQANVFEFTTTGGIAPFAPLLQGRAGHNAATLADNSVIVVGGTTSTGPVAEVFRPQAGTGVIASSVLQGAPGQARENGALAVLPTNQVLWTGGVTIVEPVQTVATAELFFGP